MPEGGAQAGKIIRDLSRMDWWARQRAIILLKACPRESYGDILIEGVRNHEDADARNAAMEALVALGSGSFPMLSGLIRDADREVRLFAVNMLCRINDPSTVPLLTEAFSDPDVNVRAACVEALGRCGAPEALPVLRKAIDDCPWVSLAAVHALGEVGGPEALEILLNCLGREELRELAIRTLQKAGTRDSIRHLSACFEYPELSPILLNAIVAIARREGIRPNPEYFFSLLPMVLRMLKSPDRTLRTNAFVALCWSQDIAGLAHMIDAVRDEDLQEYAIDGLLAIGRRALCSIVDELRGSSGSHRAVLAKVLSMIEEPVALLQFAEDEDPEVRTEVALALGSLRDLPRAHDTLIAMLSDPHEEVRGAARISLRSWGDERPSP